MSIEILDGDIHLIDLKTRLPFKYGIATMTEAPHAFVRLRVRVGQTEATGIAADHLPPKWFTKVPEKPLEEEVAEMLATIEQAVLLAKGTKAESAFDAWQQLDQQQEAWGRDVGFPPLLANFGMTLVERALIEATAKASGETFAALLRRGGLGVRLDACDSRLAGSSVADLLPGQPLGRVIARHTIGMVDPLTDGEIAVEDRLADGLPQSLEACIARYGLCHFKIKVNGDLESDVERLRRIASILQSQAGDDYAFTLDGNEQFRELGGFREYWQQVSSHDELQAFFGRLMFVEQPFHRDVALNADVLEDLVDWQARPPLIIDESDARPDSLAQALALGYHGTSHKNCKGVFRGVVNACLLAELNRGSPGAYIMSGEDLANIGPVALLQDLVVASTLGVESVERNGHHYFAGLSAFPEAVQSQVLAAHDDLYGRADGGWPTLALRNGGLDLRTVHAAPLGVGFELDVGQFTPSSTWRNQHGL